MAEEGTVSDEQLIEQDEPEEQPDQLDNQVEDAEKQDETTTEPPSEKDGETAEANADTKDEAQDAAETKDADEGPTDKQESDEPATPSFPKTLEEFGYKFNEGGQLRQIGSDKSFVFKVKESDSNYNQLHYQALGEVITDHVYQLLESDTKLTRTDIPIDVTSEEPRSFIFESGDARTADKLMVLIHGSGVVRAGQWSRRLIINDSLDKGTQLPFIKHALENSYGVMVLNTNRNSDIVNGEALPVRESGSAEEHTLYVWDHVISKCEAKHIHIVAHSYGGVAVLHLLVHRFDGVNNRVEKIAFTDSVHSVIGQCPNRPDIAQWISEHAVNWVTSVDPINTVIAHANGDAGRLSAGTKVHEETSWCSFDSIFKYFTGEEDYIQLLIKSTSEPEVPVTKTEEEPVVTKAEDEPVDKTEEEPAVTKAEDEPVDKTEEEPVVTKTEDEPVDKTEEEPVVTKTEDEPVDKTEEPVPKTQEPDKDIDKRIDESGHHQKSATSTQPQPPDAVTDSPCCVII